MRQFKRRNSRKKRGNFKMDPFSSKAIILKLKAKIVYKKGGASAQKA